MRRLIRGCIALALSALLLAMAAGAAGAVSFGFSEPTGACSEWGTPFCSQWMSGIGSLTAEPAFRTLVKRLPLRYARLNAPYNLLADYNPSTRRCQPSAPFARGGDDGHGYLAPGEGWQILRSELAVARANGMVPLVTITDGRALGSPKTRDPKWPIPMYWNGRSYSRTVAGEGYRCGLSALIKAITDEQRSAGARPADWETFNEPDARSSYNGRLKGACGGASSSCRGHYRALCAPSVRVQCGPLEAAWLYVELSRQLKSAGAGGRVAAMAVTRPGIYTNGYLHELIDVLHARPAVLSFHDYIDPTSNGASIAHHFAVSLEKRWGGRFELWITESGVYLSEWADLPLSGGSSRAHGCQFGTNHDRHLHGLGRCVDGNARAQTAGASDFKYHLAHDGSYRSAQITELFWYEFRALPPTTSGRVQWDSGLLDASGVPRTSYCVLAGATGCKGNPFRNK
jgi:hypothetical protein